jgi:hypothetical protein
MAIRSTDHPIQKGSLWISFGVSLRKRTPRAKVRSCSPNRIKVRVTIAPGRARQNQRIDPLGIRRGKPKHASAPHRLPHKGGPLDAEPVE